MNPKSLTTPVVAAPRFAECNPAPLVFGTLETDDFDQYAQAVSHWNLDFVQLKPGSSTSSLRFTQAGCFQLIRSSFGCRVHIRGQATPGCYVLNPVVPKNASAIWRGSHFKPGTINFRTPGESIDHRTCDDYESISLVIDSAYLERLVKTTCGFELPDHLGQRNATFIDPEQCQAFYNSLSAGFQLAQNVSEQATACLHLETHLKRCLTHFLANVPQASPFEPPPLGFSRRCELSRNVQEYMRAHLGRPLTLPRICEEFDVSARTLAYAFTEATGLAPKAYLRTLRLNQVRRELKKADPNESTILQIACRWGLDHPGAFAAAYRRLFGELPSDTLKNKRSAG